MALDKIIRRVADPLGIVPKNKHKSLLKTAVDPLGVFAEQEDEFEESLRRGSKQMKSGGLVTQGSKQEKSRLTGKFKIV